MAGPYPPHQGADVSGSFPTPPSFPAASPGYPGQAPPIGPGSYPAPLPYPQPPRRRGLLAALAALAVIAVIAAAVVFAVRSEGPSQTGGVITSDTAKRSIQNYLDALSNKDLQTISRNALCGLYDGVRDRRSDDALAKMSSDAFQKQFSKTEVTSVDTIVFQSANSAQVLFTMRTAPPSGISGGPEERQGVAQLLAHNNEVLVCSYVLRTAGAF